MSILRNCFSLSKTILRPNSRSREACPSFGIPHILQNREAQSIPFQTASQPAHATSMMATSQEPESNRRWNGQPKKKFGKQLTHFLCFPLLSDDILQPFGSSLEYFRNISTAPKREHPLKARERAEAERQRELEEQSQTALNADNASKADSLEVPAAMADDIKGDEQGWTSNSRQSDPFGNTAKATGETFEESLRIIPSISHRPLGTYHLTIGVMNLSEAEEFKKCEEIFNSLDLKQLLRDAENGPPSGSTLARKWKNERHNGRDEKEEANEAKEPVAPNFNDGAKTETMAEPKSHEEISREQTISTPDLIPINISLLGLGAFNSPRRARVLYAHPCEQIPNASATATSRPSFNSPFPNRLYNFALHIEAPFRAAGLIKETRLLTLHATLVNIRHKVQPKGGRTSKGKAWTHGRKRWDDSCVDAELLCTVFNEYSGNVEAAKQAIGSEHLREQEDETEDSQPKSAREAGKKKKKQDDRDKDPQEHSKEFLWAQDVPVNRLALCELGAKKSSDEFLGLEYPPVLEKLIFEA